jgi:hypothetical protein
VLAEVAQVRLHDPASPSDPPIAEGAADVEFTLRDIQIPLDEPALLAGIKKNFAANPRALADMAELLNNNAEGDADFYYYRPDASNGADIEGDYLYFVTADDLRTDAQGALVRPYAYARPGFFADAELTTKLSTTAAIDGDTTHEKLKVTRARPSSPRTTRPGLSHRRRREDRAQRPRARADPRPLIPCRSDPARCASARSLALHPRAPPAPPRPLRAHAPHSPAPLSPASSRLAAAATRLAVPLCRPCDRLAPSAAWASGLDAPMVGSGQSGPTTRDGAAIHWNPANLAYMKKGEFFGGLMLVVGDIRYQRDYRAPTDPGHPRVQSPSPREHRPRQDGLRASGQGQPARAAGQHLRRPPADQEPPVSGPRPLRAYGAPLKFDRNGPQALQLQQAFIVASHITACAGVRLHDMVSLGAGVSYVLGFAELAKKQDFGSVAEFGAGLDKLGQDNSFGPTLPSDVRELDTLSRPIALKKAFSHGVSFTSASPSPDQEADPVARVPARRQMRYRGKFALDMNDPFFTQDLAAQGLKFKPLVRATPPSSSTCPSASPSAPPTTSTSAGASTASSST